MSVGQRLSPEARFDMKDKKIEVDDLRDVIAEETSRGRRQPKRALSLERSRKIRAAALKLADKNCSEREYLEAIREIVPDGSPEFLAAVELLRAHRGFGKS